MGPSRWASDDTAATADRARRKKEKKAKEKAAQPQTAAGDSRTSTGRSLPPAEAPTEPSNTDPNASPPPSPGPSRSRSFAPSWAPCRHVANFDRLNDIDEGTYGSVSRARELDSGIVVALKRLKTDSDVGAMDAGLPTTALREMQTLQAARGHDNIVHLREVVVGERSEEGVFLVLDFVEHDLKTLQEDMAHPFELSETKTLLLQLGAALEFLHDHWILHRDLKTSNILLTNRGTLKLADFGMARFTSEPAPSNLTRLVVTLWYRAPELLLGTPAYDAAIDMWSVGCVFAELLTRDVLFAGRSEIDQTARIFALLGHPSEETWSGFSELPNARSVAAPTGSAGGSGGGGGGGSDISHSRAFAAAKLLTRFPDLPLEGLELLVSLLALDPASRPSADELRSHPFFTHEKPRPKAPSLFPTFPSKASMERQRRHRNASPPAPRRGDLPGWDLAGDVLGKR